MRFGGGILPFAVNSYLATALLCSHSLAPHLLLWLFVSLWQRGLKSNQNNYPGKLSELILLTYKLILVFKAESNHWGTRGCQCVAFQRDVRAQYLASFHY